MSDRRLAITGSIPLPDSLVLAGKMQSFVGGLLDELQTKLKESDIDGEIEVKVVTNRPHKAKEGNGAAAPVPGPATALADPDKHVVDTELTGGGSSQTPSWAKPA